MLCCRASVSLYIAHVDAKWKHMNVTLAVKLYIFSFSLCLFYVLISYDFW